MERLTLLVPIFLNYASMKFVSRILFALCLPSLVLLTGCDLPFGKDDPVIVSVGKNNLTKSKLLRMVPQWESLDDRTRLAFLEHWIDEEVVYQKGLLRP